MHGFGEKIGYRGTKWGYALRVSKFVQAENRVLPENDTSVAPYTSRKPDFARGRHKCKRPVLTGFCSRSTPIRLRSRVGDQRRSRLEKPSSRWLKLVLGPHEFVFFHHLELYKPTLVKDHAEKLLRWVDLVLGSPSSLCFGAKVGSLHQKSFSLF